jgi:glycosyltransferase involved in cell wall biosynthesis
MSPTPARRFGLTGRVTWENPTSDLKLQAVPTDLKSLSIVVPAYNEQTRLPTSVHKILKFADSRSFTFFELLVVDDGSTDATADCVRKIAETNPAVRLLQNPANRGKGFSVRHGMSEARGDWVLFTDADLSAPIDESDKLFAAVVRNNADAAIGSRALDPSLIDIHQPGAREIIGRIFNVAARFITGLPYKDTQCGFKLYSAAAARQIFARQELDGFGFDVEDLFIAARLGVKVVEVPVRWSNVAGTKVSLIRGIDSFLDLLRIRWFQIQGRYAGPHVISTRSGESL